MSKYSDIVALLDWVDGKKEKKVKRYTVKDDDPFTSLVRMKRMADEFKKFTDDLEKINKKEDKKKAEGWDSYNFLQKFIILTAIVPLVVIAEVGLLAKLILVMAH